jgi:hypothetical protein
MLYDGWEFASINLFDKIIKQTSEEIYKRSYNLSYDKFIGELCIPTPLDMFEKNDVFTYYISCENDEIILDETFEYTFLKSIFFKNCYNKIKSDLISYYNPFNITIRNFYKTGNFIFLLLTRKQQLVIE